jgi:hypothetical protein
MMQSVAAVLQWPVRLLTGRSIHPRKPVAPGGSIFYFVVEYPDRLYDIRNAYQPAEVGACVPPAPKKLMGPRPNRPVVLHSADVFVDKNGIVYCTDWSGAGLHIMEYGG